MKKSSQPEQRERAYALGQPLSPEELGQVTGGITTKMPPLYYGDATYGDMRLIPKTPLVSK
jgi:hypothetical protein